MLWRVATGEKRWKEDSLNRSDGYRPLPRSQKYQMTGEQPEAVRNLHGRAGQIIKEETTVHPAEADMQIKEFRQKEHPGRAGARPEEIGGTETGSC